MVLYDAFDSITEPGRPQSTPYFLRVARTRRARTVIIVSLGIFLVLLLTWRTSPSVGLLEYPEHIVTDTRKSLSRSTTAGYRILSDPSNPYSPEPIDGAPLLVSEKPQAVLNATTPSGLLKTKPSFHLLIPASHSNSKLCKTLLSAFVLGYPSPTLINYKKVFEGDGWDNGTHVGKIRGIYDYLKNGAHMKDDDLVLIIDGFDVWFQLPPDIMVSRYHSMVVDANKRLRRRYGAVTHDKPDQLGEKETVQKYTQSVMFAADKICWPNPLEDPACAAVPYSPLPNILYGPQTDKDPEAYLNRPRFLNSGTILGPLADVRAIYDYAVKKVEEDNRGTIGDQFVFSEIFGEQEYQRETLRQASKNSWLDYLSNAIGVSDSPLASNKTINPVTTVPGKNYEFSLGLDYGSELFQTMTHSTDDVDFIRYNDSDALDAIQAKHQSLRSIPFYLPADLLKAEEPFWYTSPGNHNNDPINGILLPFSPKLDQIDLEPVWEEVPLATNLFLPSIPTLLHINGDKSILSSWWSSMWFQPYARPLLRRYVRSSQGLAAAQAAAEGGLSWWDTRGGRGGVWTDQELWMSWGEVCKKTEDDVFADGKGKWGKEEGSARTTNTFGKVMIDDEDKNEEDE